MSTDTKSWQTLRTIKRKTFGMAHALRAMPKRLPDDLFACWLKMASGGLAVRQNERLLRSLKDRHKGKRIFIIGNGPSLNLLNLDNLRGEITIGSNSIFLIFERTVFRPTYYTIEDTLVAEDRAKEANALQDCIKIFPLDVRHWLRPSNGTAHVNFIRQYPDFPRFSDDFLAKVFWGGTVTYLNIQLAYYLGAAEVYLIGIDHNYAPPAVADQVAGPVITSHSTDQNHFDPRYFGPGYRWHDPKVDRMELGYSCAKHFFEQHGRKIYNATRGGKLEVFERVDFDSLFPRRGGHSSPPAL